MATSPTPQPDSLYTFNPDLGTFSSSHVENGEFIEDTDTCKALVTALFKEQFGMDEGDAATPMGRLIEWLALNFATAMRVNVQNANQLVLSAAAGQQLDAIALWFGLYRKPAVPTTVRAILQGTQGTTIPAGSRARTSDGAVFVLQSDVDLTESATLPDETVIYQGEGVFFAQEVGPVGCPADTLTTIDTPTLGWSIVYNPADGVIGRYDETDDALRARIEASRFHGNGFIYSMKNAIEAIDGVRASMVVENYTGEHKTIHGVDRMEPHSIFVCVECDASDLPAVAKAVFDQKPCGTAYHTLSDGSLIEQTVTDAYGNEYPVYIHKPTPVNVNVNLVVRNRSYSGADLVASVKSAATSWFEDHGYSIGETVYSSDIIKAVESALPGVIVLGCGVNDGGPNVAAGYDSGDDEGAAAHALSYLDIAAYRVASVGSVTVTVK